jgi:AbrB family looped-hinge helix DNA binding protein
MTTKGQITVPAAVREKLGLEAGSRVDFTEQDGGYLISVRTVRAADLAGALPKPARPVSLEEMDRAIAEGAIASAAL